MRLSALRLLLTGCAALALAPVAVAQDAPVIVDPPLSPPAVVIPPAEAVDPSEALPPAVVPIDEEVEEAPPAPPIPAEWAPVPLDPAGRSAYGLYLSGRVAGIRGARADAAEFLARSHALTPEQPVIGEEAFRAALFTGDLETVVRLTPMVESTPLFADAGRLFAVIRLLDQGDGAGARAALQDRPFGAPYGSVARYLLPAVNAAAGDWDAALQPVQAAPGDPAGLVLRLQRARLLELRRRHEEADAEYQALMALPEGVRLFGVAYGEFLERRGRRAEAEARYRASLAGPGPEPAALRGLERLQRRARPPAAPSVTANAADALVFAAMEVTEYDLHELAAIYLRLALALDPEDSTALRLGHAFAGAEQEAPAQAAFLSVSEADPIVHAGAQYNLGLSLRRQDRPAEALAALRRADAAAPGQVLIALELAGQLLANGEPAEALTILDRPMLNTADQPAATRFLRGNALHLLGRIEEAEAELWAALQAQPDDPALLNYLGYLWVDTGRRVDQGAEMIARAHAAEPDNGNIQDSLGWAQYRQGLYEAAVETLEGAVEKEPANAEINDHLGDAYWRVGRRREAEWQWSRVLTLDPDADRRAAVERKLAEGLGDPAPAAAAGA
ncbi:tetratricopeptide repeat protein [Brevundimonas viscosa]|uniref:Tetratricopeptide repeat-containing protein n=1 Tax=Brevundimonas viscosa TaxID=871741 RepID=A0A1I6SGP0_9CAUL|nr:tetratricopeptide repeat protein [Brevundimonas viscosa]SFS76074.1 Tetratricopeptide repeat-containing protein [Brevundimonas viscosa]